MYAPSRCRLPRESNAWRPCITRKLWKHTISPEIPYRNRSNKCPSLHAHYMLCTYTCIRTCTLHVLHVFMYMYMYTTRYVHMHVHYQVHVIYMYMYMYTICHIHCTCTSTLHVIHEWWLYVAFDCLAWRLIPAGGLMRGAFARMWKCSPVPGYLLTPIHYFVPLAN